MKRIYGRPTAVAFAAIIAALVFCGAFTLKANAAESSAYYVCYESDDYRVRAANVMSADGDKFTLSPYLSRGDKLLVSDGSGRLWGDEKGQPIAVKESGRSRYTVCFTPETESVAASVELLPYTPEKFEILVDGTESGRMNYLKASAVREEYYFYLDLKGGETVSVRSQNGTLYGTDGIGADGVSVPLEGRYRFAFTADEDNLFADDKYIVFSEYPTLYLLCEENEFEKDEAYRMERDEDVTAFEQYKSRLFVPKKDCDLSYRVLDADENKEYRPSQSGSVTVKDKGEYNVLYSPNHIYSASGDETYRVALERKSEFYDGWYVLGDFNGFTYLEDNPEFDGAYKLAKNEEETAYDEYELTLTVDRAMLKQFDQRVEFYITDGESIYRKVNGGNIGIETEGEYELTFSPTHDYGHGYRYRYVRVGDAVAAKTVKISTPRQLAELLSACTSAEYSLNMTVVLTNDVDMSGVDYSPATIFSGTFDGSYRTVKGVRNIGEGGNSLFREIASGGVLQRTTFETELDSLKRNTALVGVNNGRIEEITVLGSVNGDGYVGGIAAVNSADGKIVSCENRAAVNGVMNVGGIVGFNAGSVEDSDNFGAVNGKIFSSSDSSSMLNIGGVAGYSTGNILACDNRGNVGARQGRYVGGIVGLSSGGIFSCANYGKADASSYVGGIVGYYGRFEQNSSSGGIGGYLTGGRFEDWLGEYFGSDSGNFEESVDSGVHEVYYCVGVGQVYSSGSYAGGIAGHAGAGSLTLCALVSSADVTAHGSHAGGIVGDMGEGLLFGSLSYGSVTANSDYAGGIVGESRGRIENCQSSAYVCADEYIGGIAAKASHIVGCVSYAFTETSFDALHIGMIAGQAELSSCRNNYYLEDGLKVGGIDGVSYGSENEYRAHALSGDKLMSEGMLSQWLYGLDADDWLAGESEPRYPVPRALSEEREPDLYTDKAAFRRSLDNVKEKLSELSDIGSRIAVTVTFYVYDFDSEEYEKAEVFRLHKGEGIEPVPTVPEEDGYFTWWDKDGFASFEADTQIYQLFDRVRTTLASSDSDRPDVLVEGKFHSDTVLELEYNGEYISPKFLRDGKATSYGTVYVRYRVPDASRYGIKLVRGGEIADAEVTVSGEYLCFALEEGWAFAAVDNGGSLFPLWITLASLGSALIVALAFGIPLVVFRAKRKKAEKKEK